MMPLAKLRAEIDRYLAAVTSFSFAAMAAVTLAATTTVSGLTTLVASAWAALTTAATFTWSGVTTLDLAALLILNGKGWRIVTDEIVLADLSADAVANAAFPAGCRPLGCSGVVETAVTTSGATNTFDAGIAGVDADAFGANIAGAQNTQFSVPTAEPTSLWNAAAQDVTLDAAGAETFTAGAVRLYVTYMVMDAPPTV